MFRNERGFALMLELLLVMGITLAGLGYFAGAQYEEHLRERAQLSGQELQMYHAAVRRALADSGAALLGNHNGSSWLKQNSPTCPVGVAAGDYLDCSLGDATNLGQPFQTQVIQDPVTGRLTAITTLQPPNIPGDGERRDLNVVVQQEANGGQIFNDPTVDTFASINLDTATGNVVSVVSTNPSVDAWLRTDGSNAMQADLDMNNNNITGANQISTVTLTATGDIVTQSDLSVSGQASIGDGVSVGDRANPASRPFLYFEHGGGVASSDVVIRSADLGEIEVTNGDGDATLSVDRLYLKSTNYYAEQGIYDATIAQADDIIQKPACPLGLVPQIYVIPVGLGRVPYQDMGAWAGRADDLGGSWRVKLGIQTESGIYETGPYLRGRAIVFTKCT